MIIEQEALIDLLLMCYHQGFQDAGSLLVELSKNKDEDQQLKNRFKEFIPK